MSTVVDVLLMHFVFWSVKLSEIHLKLWHFSHWRLPCRLDVSTCANLVQIFSGIQTIRGYIESFAYDCCNIVSYI